MPCPDLTKDIDLQLATSAHAGTSHSPDKRGHSEVDDYVNGLASDYAALEQLADSPEKLELLEAEFERYRQGYRKRKVDLLHARSRCMSTMIAGPSNFPVRQQQKRNETVNRRINDLIEFRERALNAIRSKLCPEDRPIMSGDADAAERLREQITEAESKQELMKAVNAVYRKRVKAKSAGKELDLTDHEQELLKHQWFHDFELRNNNANIRRMKQRLAHVEHLKSLPVKQVESDSGIRLEDCPADNRVRLFFPVKPDNEARGKLKSSGFRWAPSLGCWQAYRNSRSITLANQFIS